MAIFNPFLPSFLADPYPAYARLRGEEPVHKSPALQAWVLTGYEACIAVLRDHQTFSSESRHATSQIGRTLNRQRLESPMGHVPTVLNIDPPVHTRLRSLVNRAFTPRVVEGLRPHIEEVTESLLAEAEPGRPFEVMAGLAQPLPVIVIAELLGVPPADRELFRRWSNAIAATTDVIGSPAILEGAREAAQSLADYIGDVVRERAREPREDLISLLLRAEEAGDRLSREELLAFAILLLVAGNETTTNLIGNGMLALLQQPPETWATLRAAPQRLPAAVEELLRFDSPVQGVVRFAVADTTLDGVPVAAGETVLAMVGAANRDPAHFAEPDRLDLQRETRNHLSFGMGIHYCLGAPLARVEAEVAFGALLRRFPAPRLVEGGAKRAGTFLLRGMGKLEVEHLPPA